MIGPAWTAINRQRPERCRVTCAQDLDQHRADQRRRARQPAVRGSGDCPQRRPTTPVETAGADGERPGRREGDRSEAHQPGRRRSRSQAGNPSAVEEEAEDQRGKGDRIPSMVIHIAHQPTEAGPAAWVGGVRPRPASQVSVSGGRAVAVRATTGCNPPPPRRRDGGPVDVEGRKMKAPPMKPAASWVIQVGQVTLHRTGSASMTEVTKMPRRARSIREVVAPGIHARPSAAVPERVARGHVRNGAHAPGLFGDVMAPFQGAGVPRVARDLRLAGFRAQRVEDEDREAGSHHERQGRDQVQPVPARSGRCRPGAASRSR